MNNTLVDHGIKLEIVRCTGPSIGQLLFNNRENIDIPHNCSNAKCQICKNTLRPNQCGVISPTTDRLYSIDPNMNCENSGIYCIQCPCSSLNTGKTTVPFGARFNQHFTRTSSSVFEHYKTCPIGVQKISYSVQFLENVHSRGKYTLSEREYLWNERLRGMMNIQKTLKN